jgi:hypothetical protein
MASYHQYLAAPSFLEPHPWGEAQIPRYPGRSEGRAWPLASCWHRPAGLRGSDAEALNYTKFHNGNMEGLLHPPPSRLL